MVSNCHSQLIHLTHSFHFLQNFPYEFIFFPSLFSSKKEKKEKEKWPTKQSTHFFKYMLQYYEFQNSYKKSINALTIVRYHVLHELLPYGVLSTLFILSFIFQHIIFLLHSNVTTPSPQFFTYMTNGVSSKRQIQYSFPLIKRQIQNYTHLKFKDLGM